MQLIKPKNRYSFVLKNVRDFYNYHYNIYRKGHMMEEDRVPSLIRIEEVNEKVANTGLLYRDYNREHKTRNLEGLMLYQNMDLVDCVVPRDNLDIDCSMLNLRNDPNKHMIGSASISQHHITPSMSLSKQSTNEFKNTFKTSYFKRRVMLLSLDRL